MRTTMMALALAGSALGLSACASDGYGPGYGVAMDYGTPYPYDGWYDGYYGPMYDGYWGSDGYFYYRSGAHEREFRRAGRDHVRRDSPRGRGGFNAFHGEMRAQQGMTMPHFRGGHGRPHRGH